MRLRARWVERPWGRLCVWEAGAGPPVLAIHGLGGSGRYWQGLVDRVGERHRVVAPDLAGFGRSDKPAEGYERGSHLEDLDVVAGEVVGAGEVVAVGHSLGAVFAALWSTRHHDELAGMALVSAPFPSGDGGPRWSREARVPGGVRVAGGVVRVAWPFLALPIAAARRYPRSVVRDYGRQTLRGRTRTMWSALYDPTIAEDLERVQELPGRIPQLLLNAADDRTVLADAQDRWAGMLPAAERRIVPRGGHQFLLRTRFEPLEDWISALSSRPT